MSKLLNRLNRAAISYDAGEKAWSAGDEKRAFRLFLAAAKGGHVPSFSLVAHFYGSGTGVKANTDAALHWYEQSYRASEQWYRQAESTSANNIGCIWRERGKPGLAIKWFKRAVALGDGDANLNIADVYLRRQATRAKALPYLRKTIAAPYVTDGSIEEARRLLRELSSNKGRGKRAKHTG